MCDSRSVRIPSSSRSARICSIRWRGSAAERGGHDHEHAARPARPLKMARDLGLDDVVDHFTLIGDELNQLRNKSGRSDDHPVLGIGGDLPAVHEMLAMTGLVTQLGVGIAVRDTAVWLDARRFGVGPDRGSASRRSGRDSAEAPVTLSLSLSPSPSGDSAESSDAWSL